MALKLLKDLLRGPNLGLSRRDAMKIFQRDHFKCQYCGLNGLERFEDWLILTVDHLYPADRGGSRRMDNLLTACQPCNVLKGKHVFKSLEEARAYVLAQRDEWRELYEAHRRSARARHVAGRTG
jgi:5-methylcytosine-specific restriction endonuclease McrA